VNHVLALLTRSTLFNIHYAVLVLVHKFLGYWLYFWFNSLCTCVDHFFSSFILLMLSSLLFLLLFSWKEARESDLDCITHHQQWKDCISQFSVPYLQNNKIFSARFLMEILYHLMICILLHRQLAS